MKKLLPLIFGISLLVGIVMGYLTTETKYFLLIPNEPKREITFANYKSLFDSKGYWNGYVYETPNLNYSKFAKTEEVYNSQNAFLFGLGALALLFILSYFYKPKTILKK